MLRLFTIVLALTFPLLAQAQPGGSDWPGRSIQLIVPFPAGSGTDVVARILQQKLAERLKQTIVVENRPGASGTLGSDMVARAAPDGYTFGIATASTHAVAPNLEPKPKYDPVRDFAPVAMLGGSPYVLVSYPGLKLTDVKSLVALARQKPGALNYGSAGPGSLAHLATALLAQMAGIEMTHIPYKASAASISDLISGRLDMQLSTIAPVISNIRSGNLKPVGVSSKRRVPALPDVPTFIEGGIDGYEAVLWMMLVAPAGTPDAVVERMNREINEVLRGEAAADLVKQGLEQETGTPAEAAERIRTDLGRWKTAASIIAK